MKSAVKTLALIGLAGSLSAAQAADNSQGRKIDLPVPIGHEVKGIASPCSQ